MLTASSPATKIFLNIAIPTFNRNQKLNDTLARLIPQINLLPVRILVLDNASEVRCADSVPPAFKEKIMILRNEYNVGLAQNIIKCFEQVKTGWLWTLSDDDEPCNDALSLIFKIIEAHSDLASINFSTALNPIRTQSIICTGCDDFLLRLDSFSNILFLSAGVYNMDKIGGNLKMAHQFSYSLAPHIVILLTSIGKEGKVLLSNETIVHWRFPAEMKERWSYIRLCLTIYTLFELPLKLSPGAWVALRNHLNTNIPSATTVYKGIILTLVNNEINFIQARYFFRQIFCRPIFSILDWRYWVPHFYYFFLLQEFPLKVVSNLYRARKKSLGLQTNSTDLDSRI